VGVWEKHPQAKRTPTPRQRKARLQEWLPFDEDYPWTRDRVQRMQTEIEYLEHEGAYRRPRRRVGRPQPRVAACLAELRGLLPSRRGDHPLWEYVATLGRVTFPDQLGPAFVGQQAFAVVKKHRQRTT